MQTCIGPSEEHVSMAGIPTEASIYGMVEKAMPGKTSECILQQLPAVENIWRYFSLRRLSPSDEGRQRQAALRCLFRVQ